MVIFVCRCISPQFLGPGTEKPLGMRCQPEVLLNAAKPIVIASSSGDACAWQVW
jgi:hypothetical protein